MKQDLLSDVSQLSTVKPAFFNKFCRIAEYCIGDYVLESKLSDEDLTEIDIGIGKLNLLITDGSLEYQFVPSMRLERLIINAFQNEESILTEKIEDGLEDRLLSAYKELF